MASLCLLGEDGIMASHWDLGEGSLAVGRDASADVTINDAALSRRHFVISREGPDYVLKDLNSKNGTWVDGRRSTQTTKLRHHDCISAGRTLFMFDEQRRNG